MKRNKLKLLAASFFVLMFVFTITLGIAAAAIADSDEQMTAEFDANVWNIFMGQKGYTTVYNHQDQPLDVLGRIPSDTIWMFSGHGGEGWGFTALYFGDPYNWFYSPFIKGGNIPSNTIKLAYADGCKTAVQHKVNNVTNPDDISYGFMSKGTTAYIGFNRDVYETETYPFTAIFASYLIEGVTVQDAALWTSQGHTIQNNYTIYGDGSITI